MKTPKLFHLVVLLAVAVALFFLPTPAEAVAPPSLEIIPPNAVQVDIGAFGRVDMFIQFCDGDTYSFFRTTSFGMSYGTRVIKYAIADFSHPGNESITKWSGLCGTGKQKKVATCGGFYIPKRVPRSPAVPVSFKGPGNMTSANIYFKKLGYSLSLWLYKYDWGSGKWQGYLNTLGLPLGKHHGRLTTFVDGVRGGGCATGGFKVVDE